MDTKHVIQLTAVAVISSALTDAVNRRAHKRLIKTSDELARWAKLGAKMLTSYSELADPETTERVYEKHAFDLITIDLKE